MMFADLKAAFDKMDRSRLQETLRGKGVSEYYLIWKMEKMYEKTEMRIRTKQGYTQHFRIMKGVKQDCVMIHCCSIYILRTQIKNQKKEEQEESDQVGIFSY